MVKELPGGSPELVGKVIRVPPKDSKGKEVAPKGESITPALAKKLASRSKTIAILPFVSNEIVYLSADEEEKYVVAQANAILDEENHFVEEKV